MEPGIGDFLKQPGVLNMLLLVVGSGVIYIVLMAYVLQRGARRRQQRKRIESGGVVEALPQSGLDLLDLFRSNVTPLEALPEPDLDMLLAGSTGLPAQSVAPAAAPVSGGGPARPGHDVAPPPLREPSEDIVDSPTQPETIDLAPEADPVPEPAAVTVYTREDSAMQAHDEVNLTDTVEVMRILRDINDGSLLIEMGGQRYRALSEIQNPDLARRFSAVVRELWNMIGGNSITARSTGVIAAVNEPTGIGRLSSDQDKPRPHMLRQVAKQMLGQTDKPSAPDPVRGIADAVEEFLQFKLATSPQFATRNIHIRPAPNQGVRIEVDNHFYDHIGDIVDPDVRDFLSTRMKEWEARQ